MAANINPTFTLVPVLSVFTVNAANTNRNGTGTIVDGVTGDTDGTPIFQIIIQALQTTTAGVIRFYLYNASAWHLFFEVAVSAVTASGTAIAFRAVWMDNSNAPIFTLKSGQKFGISTDKAEEFRITVIGGAL